MTIDTSTAALRKLSDEYLGDYEDTKVMRDTLLAIAAEKEAQTTVDAGALRMALNVLRRAGKDEVADALETSAVRGEKEAQQHAHCEPFVVRHYGSEERPLIKGNGFDGLEIGDNRDEAEGFVAWINEQLKAQHHPKHHLEMVAPADVPLPEPMWPRGFFGSLPLGAYSADQTLAHREAYAKAAVAAEREMREALELIATPKRPDGTWNRDREACRQLAAEALGRYNEKQKGM